MRWLRTAVLLLVLVSLSQGFVVSAQTQGNDTIVHEKGQPQYYTDDNGVQREIDNLFYPAVSPWDWQMVDAPYNVRVKDDLSGGQIIEFSTQGEYIYLQPMALEWTNDLNQIQTISMPSGEYPVITNAEDGELPSGQPYHQGSIKWNDAYGSGVNLQWLCNRDELAKILEVESMASLPSPASYIIAGGNPVLRFNLIFAPSNDVDIYTDGSQWNRSSKVQTFNRVEFRKDGEVLYFFQPLEYWDSNSDLGRSAATLREAGSSLYISVEVPYSWLQSAVYPVSIDADIQVESSSLGGSGYWGKGGPFWTDEDTGYIVFIDSDSDLSYRKTADGGATWGAQTTIMAGTIFGYDCWADWQTPGDGGTRINIAYLDSDDDDANYIYLDTSGDSVSGDDQIESCQGTGAMQAGVQTISITKSVGGNYAVAFVYRDSSPTGFEEFYTSPDASTWTNEASPYETDENDRIELFPGDETDTDDLWAIYYDNSTTETDFKVYDDSGDSWSTTNIDSDGSTFGIASQMDGTIRFSDGHLIAAYWNLLDNAAADLKVVDIASAASITAKTNVITNTAEYATVSVFIDQASDDIYVTYLGGTLWTSLVKAYYQKSDDGGATWGGQSTMQDDAEDDERWVSAGSIRAYNGRFQPTWFNDDLGDIFVSTANDVEILVSPSVATAAATNEEETTATLNGSVTAINDTSITDRGFVWDTVSRGDPGNTAPAASAYANNWTESGAYGVAAFNHGVTGLNEGDLYYYRACAQNDDNFWSYGSEVTFLTKPLAPTNLVAAQGAVGEIDLSWTKGTGADRTMVRWRNDHFPVNTGDGTQEYYGVGVADNHPALDPDLTYYYSAWSEITDGGHQQFSDTYDTATGDPLGDYLVIIVDSVEQDSAEIGGVGVPDNANDWVIMSNVTPYFDYYQHSVGGALVTEFDPDDITVNTGEAGTADAGTNATLDDAILTQGNDYWIGARLIIVTTTDTNAPQGENSIVTDFDAALDRLTFAPVLTAAVDAGDTYTIDFGTLDDTQVAANDGVITWGLNPTGVGSAIGSMVSSQQNEPDVQEDETPDVLPPIDSSDWYETPAVAGTLLTHPLRPFVTIMSDTTSMSESQAWTFLGLVAVVMATVMAAIGVRRHLLIAGIVCGAMIGLLVAQTIWPFWTLVLIIPAIAAGVVAERSPSL